MPNEIDIITRRVLHRHVFSIVEGSIVLEIPSPVCDESAAFIVEWLELITRTFKRPHTEEYIDKVLKDVGDRMIEKFGDAR